MGGAASRLDTDAPPMMARALAALYGAGAGIGALTLLLPHAADSDDGILWSNVALALCGGLLLWALADRRWLRPWMLQVALAFGTLIITRAILYGGGSSSFYNLWFVWVGLYSFFFFGRGWGAAHMAVVGVAYGFALMQIEATSGLARWVMTISTIAIAGVLIDALAGAARRRAAETSRALARLDRVARTDDLTGLANRRGWEEHLKRELARAAREGTPLCVAMIDLDNFKDYNDRFGHQAGDLILKQAAVSWQEAMRATDILARYGGEEFALAIPAANLDSARLLLERVRDATPGDQRSSAGVAQWNGIESGADLVSRADLALYQAKRSGRDRVIVRAA